MPEELRKGMTFVPVERVEQVWKTAMGLKLNGRRTARRPRAVAAEAAERAAEPAAEPKAAAAPKAGRRPRRVRRGFALLAKYPRRRAASAAARRVRAQAPLARRRHTVSHASVQAASSHPVRNRGNW